MRLVKVKKAAARMLASGLACLMLLGSMPANAFADTAQSAIADVAASESVSSELTELDTYDPNSDNKASQDVENTEAKTVNDDDYSEVKAAIDALPDSNAVSSYTLEECSSLLDSLADIANYKSAMSSDSSVKLSNYNFDKATELTAVLNSRIYAIAKENSDFLPLSADVSASLDKSAIGDKSTLAVTLNRSDVTVKYQWQKKYSAVSAEIQRGNNVAASDAIYAYGEDESTEYYFPYEDVTESELLASTPEATWPGIELYNMLASAAKAASYSGSFKVQNSTQNYALQGYTAVFDTDNQEFVLTKGSESITIEAATGKVDGAAAKINDTAEWENIKYGTKAEYTHRITADDAYTSYRCVITITDSNYLNAAKEFYKNENVDYSSLTTGELSLAAFADSRNILEKLWDFVCDFFAKIINALFVKAYAAAAPSISADGQYVKGIDSSWEYITEDYYNQNSADAARSGSNAWTKLAGGTRLDGSTYTKVALHWDRKLEVNSQWYGKTIYFRQSGQSGKPYSIDVPAITTGTEYYKYAIRILDCYEDNAGDFYSGLAGSVNGSSGSVYSYPGGTHVTMHKVQITQFNADPKSYMYDAEYNALYDSVIWGVYTDSEPDVSGKAYWALKSYIADGYGFLIGHDTLYAYAGAYKDAYGVDYSEANIDPNDGATRYYELNSYPAINGHWNMNGLMGWNGGNYGDVETASQAIALSPSGILSTGGDHGSIGKTGEYGNNMLLVTAQDYSQAQATASAKYREPTNFPYGTLQSGVAIAKNTVIPASLTHTNGEIAYGKIWMSYYGVSTEFTGIGLGVLVNSNGGTNNFYLSGEGNFLQNEVGHIVDNKNIAFADEARIFVNSLFYISQRKQCEVCAANQNGQQAVHFVHRVTSANASQILTILKAGGNYWYPLSDCYLLTDDITLPEGWSPISNFNGHWDSDIHTVTLASNNAPLFANGTVADETKWNLGADATKGTQSVFSSGMTRTTGVARVVGCLDELFNTTDNYAGYVVRILGSDNPKYMTPSESYTCTVNTDNKYVISNLPCIYNSLSGTGILSVRVYEPDGTTQVTEYGNIKVNVNVEFWNNDMTTKLYLGSFKAEGVGNYTTYESAQGIFTATSTSDAPFALAGWEYKVPGEDVWQTVPAEWDVTIDNTYTKPGSTIGTQDIYRLESKLTLNNADPKCDNYNFRAVFTSAAYGTWNTYGYYFSGITASNAPFEGANYVKVAMNATSGLLNVKLWPAYATQSDNKTAAEGNSVSFNAYGYALADGAPITVRWQYSTYSYTSSAGVTVYDWHYIDADGEYGGLQTTSNSVPSHDKRVEVDTALINTAPTNNLVTFWAKNGFEGVTSTLTLNNVDIDQSGTHFRAEFTSSSVHGTTYQWYSSIGDDNSGAWNTNDGTFAGYTPSAVSNHSNVMTVVQPQVEIVSVKSASFTPGNNNQDLSTPDEYGQTLLIGSTSATVATGSAVYRAEIYYKDTTAAPVPTWQYMSYLDRAPKALTTAALTSIAAANGATVVVSNAAPQDATYLGQSGWKVIISTMTLSNVPSTMFNAENMTKYFFRCIGSLDYTTVRRTKSISRTDKWGGLTLDYAISITHNGVIGYAGENIINSQTVTDLTGVQSATNAQAMSTWAYPNLKVTTPVGHHINTAVVAFKNAGAINANDKIVIDAAAVTAMGITIIEQTNTRVVMVATTTDTVATSVWQDVLRNNVRFNTYDAADFTYAKITSGTTGGAIVSWSIDESRYGGSTFDPTTGHVYVLKDYGAATSYAAAAADAKNYNSTVGTSGYLAEINSDAENTIVHNILGARAGWLGGINSGGWKWASNNSAISLNHWSGSAQTGNPNLFMQSDGTWNSGPLVATVPVSGNAGSTAWAGFDSAKQVTYSTSELSIPANLSSPYQIQISYEYSGAAGGDVFVWTDYKTSDGAWHRFPEGPWNMFCIEGYGNTVRTYSLPTNAVSIKASVYNNASAVLHYGYIRISQAYVWATATSTTNPVTAAVYEYNTQQLAIVDSDHSAADEAVVGTKLNPIVPEGKSINVSITGNAKVYDKTQISPKSLSVTGTSGADISLVQVTYSADIVGNVSGYASKTVGGSNYADTGAVNATRYHAVVSLTPAAAAAGWTINTAESQLECDLTITPRTVNLVSGGNNKVYDSKSSGIIANIHIADLSESTGLIAGDVANLSQTTLNGFYTSDGATPTMHNSTTNNAGVEWVMQPNASEPAITIVHDAVSDPFYNYIIGTISYTGAITPRPLTLHSRYLEDATYPRNVRAYDGTNVAVVNNIVADNILPGDNIDVVQGVAGTYATANAGEALNADGTVQADRLLKLTENVITPAITANLTGNTFGDYFVASQDYSGAIYRAAITAQVGSTNLTYGDSLPQAPYSDDVYTSTSASTSWLNIIGLIGSDVLRVKTDKLPSGIPSEFQYTSLPDGTTPVGTDTTVTYVGLVDSNYAVLSNYTVHVIPGTIRIAPRILTVKVDGGYKKYYLDDNPTFTATITGFVNGDTQATALDGTLAFNTSCTTDSAIIYKTDGNGNLIDDVTSTQSNHAADSYGSYPIVPEGLAVKANVNGTYNYEINYVSGDITVVEGTYTIHYDGNGATNGSVDDSVMTYNHTDQLNKNNFTRGSTITYDNNYFGAEAPKNEEVMMVFRGWTDTPLAKDSFNSGLFAATTNKTPITSSSAYMLDKSYVLNLRAKNLAAVTIYAMWQTQSTTLPRATRPGYEFTGWYLDTGATQKVEDAGDQYTPTTDITLYAGWKVVDTLNATVTNVSDTSPYVGTNTFRAADAGETGVEIWGPVTSVTVTYPQALVDLQNNGTEDCGLTEKTYTVGELTKDPNDVFHYTLNPGFTIPVDVADDYATYAGAYQVTVTAHYDDDGDGTDDTTLTQNPDLLIVSDGYGDFHTVLR